jgi:hypothetical protein
VTRFERKHLASHRGALGIYALGEQFALYHLVGAVLVAGGIGLASLWRAPAAPEARAHADRAPGQSRPVGARMTALEGE